MKNPTALLLASVALFPTVISHSANARPVAAPILWQGIRVGMTEAQVKAAMPGLRTGEKSSELSGINTTVEGMKLNIHVYMVDGRVSEVNLVGGLPDILATSLTRKYGSPIEPYECRTSIAYICSGEWKGDGSVQIRISSVVTSGGETTRIIYSSSDSSNL